MFPRGANASALWRFAGVNDCCNNAAFACASHTDRAQCRSFVLVDGSCSVVAIYSLFVVPPIAVSRRWSGPAILKKAPMYPPVAWVSNEVNPAPPAPTGRACVECSAVGDCWMVANVAVIASSVSREQSWARVGGTTLSTCPNLEIPQV